MTNENEILHKSIIAPYSAGIFSIFHNYKVDWVVTAT